MDEDIADYVLKLLQENNAEYAEVRLENEKGSVFSLKNGVLEVSAFDESRGIGARYLVNNTLGFLDLNVFDRERIKALVEKSLRLTRNASKIGEKIKLSNEEMHRVNYKVKQKIALEQNPEDKISKLKELDKAVRGAKSRLLHLSDALNYKYFVNSEGSRIQSEIPRVNAYYYLTIGAGKKSIQRFYQYGGCGGYELWKEWDLLKKVPEELRALKKNLLYGKKIKPGMMDVVTGPEVTGIAVHESCGHPYEADRIFGREGAQAGESFVKKSDIGKRIGSNIVTIADDPCVDGGFGYYLYDDEGVKARRKILMKNGLVNEFLHNRETAAMMNMKSNGGARANGYDKEPLVRMSNTFVLPGEHNDDELFRDVKKGIYLKSFMEWNIDDKRWHQKYVGSEAYLIEKGEVTKPVVAPVLEITTPGFWGAVDGIGKKSEFSAASCGKGEPQQGIPVFLGGPHMRLRNVHMK